MSPTRHEDDFRRREIEDWDEYVQEEIQDAISREKLDDLPDKGKPIKIWRTELNPEYDLAFSRLKNAGVMPLWMELDAEVSRLNQELESFLDRSRAHLERQLDDIRQPQPVVADVGDAPVPCWRFWQRIAAWWRLDPDDSAAANPPVTVGVLIVQRDRMRDQYLERAAALDKKTAEYHNALPRELSHLQRLRIVPERAARMFDERIPARMLVDDADTTT